MTGSQQEGKGERTTAKVMHGEKKGGEGAACIPANKYTTGS